MTTRKLLVLHDVEGPTDTLCGEGDAEDWCEHFASTRKGQYCNLFESFIAVGGLCAARLPECLEAERLANQMEAPPKPSEETP